MSRDEAADIALQHFGGRLLSVNRANGFWKIKMLSGKGEVRIIRVDATSGEIVKPE